MELAATVIQVLSGVLKYEAHVSDAGAASGVT
jgi:hypothetical protein